jgi:hypothetical protein
MVGDRWGVSEKWNIAVAALYGALIGLPLQVVQDAITDDRTGMVLVRNPEFLLLGVMGGAAVFVLVAYIRNRIVLKSGA